LRRLQGRQLHFSPCADLPVTLGQDSFLPAFTGSVSFGNHIQTKASWPFRFSEVIMNLCFLFPGPSGKQGKFVLNSLRKQVQWKVIVLEQPDTHKNRHFKNEPYFTFQVPLLDFAHGTDGDSGPFGKLGLSHPALFPLETNEVAEQLSGFLGIS
jgi:hypothetical protein